MGAGTASHGGTNVTAELGGIPVLYGTAELGGTTEFGGIPKLSDDVGYITVCIAGGDTAFVPSDSGITVGTNAPDAEIAVRTGSVAPIIGDVAPGIPLTLVATRSDC